MNSKRLSERAKQPGHDRTFLSSESQFIEAARDCLDPIRYRVEDHPRDLASIFPSASPTERGLGVVPEASVTSLTTGKKFFVEVKKQGSQGNAEERAMKHHTVQFYKTLHDKYGYPFHPFVTVFCDQLAVLPRYTRKFAYLLEPEQYFLWEDYDLPSLCAYLRGRCQIWLDIP